MLELNLEVVRQLVFGLTDIMPEINREAPKDDELMHHYGFSVGFDGQVIPLSYNVPPIHIRKVEGLLKIHPREFIHDGSEGIIHGNIAQQIAGFFFEHNEDYADYFKSRQLAREHLSRLAEIEYFRPGGLDPNDPFTVKWRLGEIAAYFKSDHQDEAMDKLHWLIRRVYRGAYDELFKQRKYFYSCLLGLIAESYS